MKVRQRDRGQAEEAGEPGELVTRDGYRDYVRDAVGGAVAGIAGEIGERPRGGVKSRYPGDFRRKLTAGTPGGRSPVRPGQFAGPGQRPGSRPFFTRRKSVPATLHLGETLAAS